MSALQTSSSSATRRYLLLEGYRAPLDVVEECLRSQDPAEALAAAQVLAERAREGRDTSSALAACLPDKPFALPYDALAVIADLAVEGLPLAIPDVLDDLPPHLASRLQAAKLCAAPNRLPLDTMHPLDFRALSDVPIERALESGLFRRVAMHTRPAMHEIAIAMIRAGLSNALIAPREAESILLDLARRSAPAMAAQALALLAEPWGEGRSCPSLAPWLADEQLAMAAVPLAVSRRDISWLRKFSTNDEVPRNARRLAISALGSYGEINDIALLIDIAEQNPLGMGLESIGALRGLKRRGLSPNETDAQRLVILAFDVDVLPIDMIAEITSSRADALIPLVDDLLAEGGSKAKATQLLGAFDTRKAMGRLVEMAQSSSDPILARCAIYELGRLEERAAEVIVLAKLEEEPDACLFALERIGGPATVQRLRTVLHGAPPPWLSQALRVLFRLDPSPVVLGLAAAHGAISSDALDELQAYAGADQTAALAVIANAPGHPFRVSAIGALGRAGGPLAVDALGALLTDGDETIREQVQSALRNLGERLGFPNSPIPCLENATNKGATLLAEAALRRLRERVSSTAETVLLLDAVIGNAHPHLVRIVRPLLRRENPEIRKRAIACLSAEGPACAPWVLPHLRTDVPLPVARQALLAVGHAAIPGQGTEIAKWLSHGNMNLKKAAAEALDVCRDPGVIPVLVDVLAQQDQPGLRDFAEKALRSMAGPFFRSLIIERLAKADKERMGDLLAVTVQGDFSPNELAALMTLRPHLPKTLIAQAYAANTGKLAGQLPLLDCAFRRRGMEPIVPREADVSAAHPLRPGLARAHAARLFHDLRQHLRESVFLDELSPACLTNLQSVAKQSWEGSLTILEQRALSVRLSELERPVLDDALALLASSTDPFVTIRAISRLNLEGELDSRHVPLFSKAIAQRGLATARAFLQDPRPHLRTQAFSVLRLAGESSWAHTPANEREALLRSRLNAGHENAPFDALEGRDALSLAQVAGIVAHRVGAMAAFRFAEQWIAQNPTERAPALISVGCLGDLALPALRELAQSDMRVSVRLRAFQELVRRRVVDIEFVRAFLDETHPDLREAVATEVFQVGNRQDRERVLSLWVKGSFGRAFWLSLDDQDRQTITDAVGVSTTEVSQWRLFGPIASLPVGERAPLLLHLFASPHIRISSTARDALRALDASYVLPHIEARLREGDTTMLDVVGARGSIPKRLADFARTSTDPDAWISFGLRAAGSGILYAADLGEVIAEWTAASPTPAALSLLARLTDWYDEHRADKLVRALAPVLAGAQRNAVIGAILQALQEQPPALVSRVLSKMVRPSDTAAIRMLATAEAASPGLLDLLDVSLRPAIEKALETALYSADPESARKLLTYFANRADRPSDRERVLVLLEQYVSSSSRRISLHAHRLLRTLAPRDRYLRATRVLLDDPDPTTQRFAIRVLAFGGDVESASKLAERLFHAHTAVSRAARDGLLALGPAAIPVLLRNRPTLRPDRRAAIDAVIEEIRSRGQTE